MFASRKRGREEDQDDMQHHGAKRSTLPFRTSPNTRHIRPLSQSRSRPSPLFTQTITPADSSEEENSPPFQPIDQAYQQHRPLSGPSSTLQTQNLDSDMDMTDSLPLVSPRQWVQIPRTPSPQASPCTMEFQHSESRQTPNNVAGGRLPTPIYGHFQRSIDTKMDLGGNPETHASRLQQETDYETYARRRRLPTPIDEDEAMESPLGMSRDLMDLYLSGHSRRGGVDYTYHPHVMGSSEKSLTYQPFSETLTSSADHAIPPPRKLSFSMGPRANCELCIRRVPGHSNHIIRT